MSMYATITRYAPGYMYDVTIYDHNRMRMRGYGDVFYTLRGARRGANRLLARAKKDQFSNGYREEVRL